MMTFGGSKIWRSTTISSPVAPRASRISAAAVPIAPAPMSASRSTCRCSGDNAWGEKSVTGQKSSASICRCDPGQRAVTVLKTSSSE